MLEEIDIHIKGEGKFPKVFPMYHSSLLTLGNWGISGATVARAARTAAMGVPDGLLATREMRSARRPKTVVGLMMNFISLAI